MRRKIFRFCFFVFLAFASNSANAEMLKKLEIIGNSRISNETIEVYGEIEINKDYSDDDLNTVIKRLYDTKFFSDISTSFSNGVLRINVKENPIIDSIIIEGEDAKKYKKAILTMLALKEKGSYIESDINQDVQTIKDFYKSLGYYTAKVTANIQKLGDDRNTINLIYSIEKGTRNKISKVYFIGDKGKARNKRLRDVITSEEARFWKVLSGNIYLNPDRIELDKRLLKNYFLGLGYYNVEVLSSSVELKNESNVELTFSINAGQRFRIKKLSTNITPVFDKTIFKNLSSEFNKFAGEYYSPFKIQKILGKIDQIIDNNKLQFVQHSVSETLDKDGIDIVFKIFEGRKIQIERVNIIGNTVTNDSVIRSELLVDEGDPYSDVKVEQSISRLKARNIFKKVEYKLNDGSSKDLKVMEIKVEEKPTGEIAAGAGIGTEGTSFNFLLKENNYLGKGLSLDASLNVTEHSIRGGLSMEDPNFRNSGNIVWGGLTNSKTDRPDSGYENTLTKFDLGTKFEHLTDLYVSPNITLAFDDLKVTDSASSSMKKQAGNFTELTFGYGIEKDNRDRPFMPTSGSLASFHQGLPLYSDQASIYNSIYYTKYHLFTENVVGALKFFGANITAIEDNVRLNKRLHIPSRRLRGFESHKVGPKDGADYVGGNYATALNFEASLPNLLPESTQTDIAIFMDAGNLWGVDYDSSINNSNGIRSSVGMTSNVYTPIGPLSFVFALPMTKESTDTTQTFNFQIGTSF
jgi:outer membrane protein insertion porin family